MTTYNTNNPVPSADPRDLFDNAQNLDQAVNSQEDEWKDRFGSQRITLKKALESTPVAVASAESAAQSAEEAKQAAGSINMPNLADSQPGDSLVVKDDKSGYRYQKVLNQVSALPTTDIGDVHLIGSGPYKWDATQSKYVPLTTAASGKQVGKVEKFDNRRHLQKEGGTPRDGQLVPRALFPDFVREYLDSGILNTVTDTQWWADTSLRTEWVANDGNGNFRVPDWNGKQPGSVAVYGGRGDGAKSNGVHGKIQFDQLQGHFHEIRRKDAPSRTLRRGSTSGTGPDSSYDDENADDVQRYQARNIISDGTNGTARVGDETRVTAPTVVWGVYLSNATETTLSPAQVDVLVGQYTVLNTELQQTKNELVSVKAATAGQTYVDVTSSRTFGATYRNTSGRVKKVTLAASGNGASTWSILTPQIRPIGGAFQTLPEARAVQNQSMAYMVIDVPDQHEYVVSNGGASATIAKWMETQ